MAYSLDTQLKFGWWHQLGEILRRHVRVGHVAKRRVYPNPNPILTYTALKANLGAPSKKSRILRDLQNHIERILTLTHPKLGSDLERPAIVQRILRHPKNWGQILTDPTWIWKHTYTQRYDGTERICSSQLMINCVEENYML